MTMNNRQHQRPSSQLYDNKINDVTTKIHELKPFSFLGSKHSRKSSSTQEIKDVKQLMFGLQK